MAGCIFCGKTPTTVEHILGQSWIRSLMPGQASFTTQLTRHEDEGDEPTIRSFRKKASSGGGAHTVNCVCGSCNGGWMQDLDSRLREALTDVVLGEPGTLHVLGCRLVAVWATKTAMLIDELWAMPLIPLQTKRHFGSTLTVPQGWTFWLAVRDESDERTQLRARTLEPGLPATTGPEAVVITFRVLHLIVQVLVPLAPVVLRHGAEARPYVHALWPRLDALQWPPPEASWLESDEALERLEEAIEAARPRSHRAASE